MKFGCCVGIERYDDLVRMGYDYIELSGASVYKMSNEEFARAKSTISEGPVKCPGFNAFLSPDVKVVGDVDKDKVYSYVDKVIYRGAELGIGTIGFGSPLSRTIPDGFSKDRAVSQVMEFINNVSEKLNPYGIKLLLEPLSKIETNFINSTGEAMEIIRQVKRDNVGLLIDLYHFCLEKEDAGVINTDILRYLGHTHIAEENGRLYPNAQNREKYMELINALKCAGYDGRMSIEANYTDFETEAREALEILKSIDRKTAVT